MTYLKTYLPYLFGNKKGQTIQLPQEISWGSLSFEETLMFHSLDGSLESHLQTLDFKKLSKQEIYHLFKFSHLFPVELKKEFDFFNQAVTAFALSCRDVQEMLNFKNNELTLFAIFPTNRRKLGKLLIRKSNGELVYDDCGNIWSMPILACSGRGLSFEHSNGQTPMGVYSIDGVMPEANKDYEFGKFRRLIVNFTNPDNLLPTSQKEKSWWKQGELARELGRSLLRIHGTGRINKNPFSSFYPFVPTSGCIATNEKTNAQRSLLDTIMKAQGLVADFENEVKIKAILYVLEFNDSFQKLIF
jgi:hypothetical protein